MFVSWAQHETVVERRSKELVQTMVARMGEPFSFEGNAPVVLDRRDAVWLVLEGGVDLFLVELQDRKPVGRRHHLARIPKGELVLTARPIRAGKIDRVYGLLAVGLSGTRVIEVTGEALRDTARGQGRQEEVYGLLDLWVRRLSETFETEARPDELEELIPGVRRDFEAGATMTAGPKTIWFHVASGDVRLGARSRLRASTKVILYPLTRASWLQVMEPSTLRLVSAETFFKSDKNWISFHHFHKQVLFTAALSTLAKQDETAGRLDTKRRIEGQRLEVTLGRLAHLGEDVSPLARAQLGSKSPLVLVLERLGAHAGFAVRVPPSEGYGESVGRLARASHIRTRQIVLQDAWWSEAYGPILAFAGDRSVPVAVLPQSRGGYRIYDPLTGGEYAANATTTAGLDPMAYAIYPGLSTAASNPALETLRFAMRGATWDLVLVLVTAAFAGLLGLIGPLAFGQIVDEVIPSARLDTLLQIGLALVLVTVTTTLTRFASGFATLRLETKTSSNLQSAVWDRLLNLPPPFFRRFTAGDLALRANGVDSVRRVLSQGVLSALLAGIFSLSSLGLLLWYSPTFGLVALGAGLLHGLLFAAFSARAIVVRRKLEDIEGFVAGLTLQLLTGITKIRAAGAERLAFSEWAKHFATKRGLEFRAERIDNHLAVLNQAFPAAAMIVLFALVSTTAGAHFTTGDFVGFHAAFGMFLGGLLGLVSVGISFVELIPLVERARPIFEAEPEVNQLKRHPGVLKGQLEIGRMTFRYRADGPAIISALDLTIRAGEFLAVVGTSGSGKSTLLRLMLGFERPESGGVFYDGQDLTSVDLTELRGQIGVVLQHGELQAGEIYSNIVGSRPLGLEEAWAAAEVAGIADDIRDMPMQMHTVLGQGGRTLSGGQRQRLLIARAVVARPKILFLDEATSALDGETQSGVIRALDRLHATRVVIAHRLSTVRNADRIIVMDDGRIVESGTYDDLMAADGPFRRLAVRQVAS